LLPIFGPAFFNFHFTYRMISGAKCQRSRPNVQHAQPGVHFCFTSSSLHVLLSQSSFCLRSTN
jgi:hypothetical protein